MTTATLSANRSNPLPLLLLLALLLILFAIIWTPKEWQCNKCGQVFVASAPMADKCPACGSTYIDIYTGEK